VVKKPEMAVNRHFIVLKALLLSLTINLNNIACTSYEFADK